MPQSRVDLNQWLSKDSIAMSKVLRTTPIMLDADTGMYNTQYSYVQGVTDDTYHARR